MPEYFDFEVELEHIEPRIWRRFLIKGDATFFELHEAIQDSFDWLGFHLWEFHEMKRRPKATIAGLPHEDDEFYDTVTPDAREIAVASFFKGKQKKCLYTYDFGDNWEHLVTLRGVVEKEEEFTRKLLDGDRSRPPEDCGSIGGYYDCIAVLEGRNEDEDDEMLREWLGDWKPDDFKVEAEKEHFDR